MTSLQLIAHSAVSEAKRRGELVAAPCEECGAFPVHAHHDDYSRPLQVRWLCPLHHRRWHVERKPKNIHARSVVLRINVTRRDLEQIQRLASADDRTVSQLVWVLVKDYLRDSERSTA